MRIAVVCEFFYPDNTGGTPTDMSDLVRYLTEHHPDCHFEVITSRNYYRGKGNKLSTKEDWDGIQITRLNTLRSNCASTPLRLALGALFSLAAFFELMRRPRYDLLLLVTNPPSTPLAAYLYRKLRRVPYVYLIHDLYPDAAVAMNKLPPGGIVTGLTRRIQQQWLQAAGRVVVVGRCMKARIERQYTLPLGHIKVITAWADPEAIRPSSRDTAFRKEHQLTGFTVLYGGNLAAWIDFHTILDAAQRLKESYPSINFLILGEGTQKASILQRVASDHLTNVRVLPPVPRSQMGEVLASSDVALIPLDERMVGIGVPSKLYPILSAGRPSIAIVPEASEVACVLEEANCGINVPQRDSTALAKAIVELYERSAFADAMGRNARLTLENHYTIHQSAAGFYDVFCEITGIAHPQEERELVQTY